MKVTELLQSQLKDKDFIIECVTHRVAELEQQLREAEEAIHLREKRVAYLEGIQKGSNTEFTPPFDIADLDDCDCPACYNDDPEACMANDDEDVEEFLENAAENMLGKTGFMARKGVGFPVDPDMTPKQLSENIEAAEVIIDYCEDNNIELQTGSDVQDKD